MFRFHRVIQTILDKLFRQGQELIEMNDVQTGEKSNAHPIENGQVNLVNHETVRHVEHQADHPAADLPSAHFEQSSASSTHEKSLPSMTKVLLNPIPGRMAFSSLVEPVHRLTSEIAAESIRHNLSDGRGMNERTYNATGEQRQVSPEPQSPLFPKSNVPSPHEMLANESRRIGRSSTVSSTPQYLKTTRKEMSPVVSGQYQCDSRNEVGVK